MSKRLFLPLFFLFLPVVFLFNPFVARGAVTFKAVEENVLSAGDRCTACHGEGKDQEKLDYSAVKGYLDGFSEDEIKDDEWFPITYCNGRLSKEKKEIILEWIRAGMPE